MTLEPEFWQAFRAIAAANGQALNDLAAEVDALRGTDRGLASAIRVFVLQRCQRDGRRQPGDKSEPP